MQLPDNVVKGDDKRFRRNHNRCKNCIEAKGFKREVEFRKNIPDNGSIRLLVITEKQYENMSILLGNFVQADLPVSYEQLTLL